MSKFSNSPDPNWPGTPMQGESEIEAKAICRDLGFPELSAEPAGAPTDNASWAYRRVLKALTAAHERGRREGVMEGNAEWLKVYNLGKREENEAIATKLENGFLTGGKHPEIARAIRSRIEEGK